MDNLTKYEHEIKEITLFAKKINYNIDNGIDELMKLWLQDGLKFQNFVKENKQNFINTTKLFVQ